MDDMCKSVFLSVFFVVLCLPRQASALTYSREDSLRVVRLLDKAAGLPAEVVARAGEILRNLEANELDVNAPKVVRKPRRRLSDMPGQMTFF